MRPKRGAPFPFYPYQAFRDTVVVSVVLLAVVAMAWRGMPPLEGPADPTDANYIPRPEWYFLGLFQLLKYFPGKWEVVGAIVIPGVVAAFLALLPWIDRGPERDPRRRPLVMTLVAVGLAGRRRLDDARLARSADISRCRSVVAPRDWRALDCRLQRLREVPRRHRPGRSARIGRALARGRVGVRARHRSGDDRARPARAAGRAERARGRGDRRLRPPRVAPGVSRLSAKRRDGRDRLGALLRRLPHDRRRRRQGRPRAVARRRQGRQATGRGDDPHVDRRSRSDRPARRHAVVRQAPVAANSSTRSRATSRRASERVAASARGGEQAL